MARLMLRGGLLALLALLTGSAWAQAPDTPLGDVVKMQKPAHKAARLITNEDLPKAPPETAGSESEAPATQTEAEEGAAPPSVDEAAARVAELKRREGVESDFIKELEAKLEQEDLSEEQRRKLSDALEYTKARLEMYQQQRAELQLKLKPASTEEEASPETVPAKVAAGEAKATTEKPPELKAPEQ